MKQNIAIKHLITKGKDLIDQPVQVSGWVKAFRSNRFIALNDGSCLSNIQVVIDFEQYEEDFLKRINTSTSIQVNGVVKESLGKGQSIEVIAESITILGDCDAETFPIQPKKHSLEFLRENAHLRFRTNLFGAVFRVRAALSFAIHNYFTQNDFYNFHAPIITGSDAEGAGEMFSVTNFDLKNAPKDETGEIDFKEDFFGKQTSLTVSGQLEAETAALALGKVYTFGPTFRAENSNTSRHLSEFWMVEPEMAFYDLQKNMDLAEDFIRSVVQYALDNCAEDIAFLDERFSKEQSQLPTNQRSEMGLIEKLKFILENPFVRLSYTEAIEILKNSKPNKKKKFDYIIEEWGADLQSEHERYLVEKHFKSPVILFDYPAKIKAFYMRLNEDGKTVRAMDVLFPGIGEIIGGSQREERYDVLKEKMSTLGVDKEELWWYLDTRKFGTVEHSGFGLGFERLVMFVTGMGNIKDVIPYPRSPKNAEF